MTRMGKSNTTKVMAKSVFELRFSNDRNERVGQLIFDYNGEYANENVQDAHGSNPSCLKNVWRVNSGGRADDVVTYGTVPHPNDPGRRLMKLNAFGNDPRDWSDLEIVSDALAMLLVGKSILDSQLDPDRQTKYIGNFVDVDLSPPTELADPQLGRSAQTRYRRAILVYRALLARAGLTPPAGLSRSPRGLFGNDLITALNGSSDDPNGRHAAAARVLSANSPSWDQLAEACIGLEEFIRRGAATGYTAFNQTYMQTSTGNQPWCDMRLERILGMFQYVNGPRKVGGLAPMHEPNLQVDYADTVYADLVAGNLVIVDQSGGEPDLNQAAAERIMWRIFKGNLTAFTGGGQPPEILVYIEEAHNLLPSGSEQDLTNVWVRAAKEGAKLRIGMVYATQEVSSIQKNILKNTANWFIAHLNNTDETRELKKYYDFADFEPSILRAQDRGFIRAKTLSNLFVVPVQVDRFQIASNPQSAAQNANNR